MNERNKKIIILTIATAMIFSGIGLASFQALSQWEPINKVSAKELTPATFYTSTTQATVPILHYETTHQYVGKCYYIVTTHKFYDEGQEITLNLYANYSGTASICGKQKAVLGFGIPYAEENCPTNNYFFFTPNSQGTSGYYNNTTGTQTTGNIPFFFQSSSQNPHCPTVNITVNTDPTTSITLSQETIDVNQQITLTANVNGGSNPYYYSWSESGASGTFSSTTAQNPTWTASGSGTADFTLTMTDSAGYKTTSTATVTVDPELSISQYAFFFTNPSGDIEGDTTQIDAGGNYGMSSTATGGSGSYTLYWDIYQGSTLITSSSWEGSSAQTGTNEGGANHFSTLSQGTYTAEWYTTDSNGYTTSPVTETITVNADPTASISIAPSQTDVNNALTISGSISGGTGPYSWQIYTSSGTAISGADGSTSGTTFSYTMASSNYEASGDYSYYAIITDADYMTYQTNTASSTINSDPTATINANVSQTDVNMPISLTSDPSAGTQPYVYQWSIGSTVIGTSEDITWSTGTAGTYTITYTLTDHVQETYTTSLTVTINPNPTVSIISSENPTDTGNALTFTANPSGGTGTNTTTWYISGTEETTGNTMTWTPSASGTYEIEAVTTDSEGHKGTAYLNETVNTDPQTSIKESRGSTDVGEYIIFNPDTTGGTSPYVYTWEVNNETFEETTLNYTFTASGTYIIHLNGKDYNGNTFTAQTTVIINPLPQVTITSEYKQPETNLNNTLTSQISGGTGPFTYAWSINGAYAGNTSSIIMNEASKGTYTAELEITDNTGKTAYYNLSITVIQDPSSRIEGPSQWDVNKALTLIGNATYGSEPYNYYWLINGINTTSGLFFSYTFDTTGTYNITLITQDSEGIKATTYQTETINALPTGEISGGINETDAGQSVTLTADINGGSNPFNIQWYLNGAYAGQGTQTTITTREGTNNISMVYIDATGTEGRAYKNIIANGPINTVIHAEETTTETNIPDIFSINTTGGTGPFTYSWKIGSTTGTGTEINYTFTASGTYVIQVNTTDSRGEKETSYTTVTVVNSPKAIIYGYRNIDMGQQEHLTSGSTGGISPFTYEWIINGHEYTGTAINPYLNTTGTYSIQLIVTDSNQIQSSTTVNVTVFSDPHISINMPTNPVTGQLTTITANVTGGQGPYTLYWIWASANTNTGTTVQHAFTEGGIRTFTVEATDSNGYTTTIHQYANVSLNVHISATEPTGYGPLSETFYSSIIGGSQYSYNWILGNGNTSVSTNPMQTYQTGNYTVTLKVEANNGATGTASVKIEAKPQPFYITSNVTNPYIYQKIQYKLVPNWDSPANYTAVWLFPNGQTFQGNEVNYSYPAYNQFNTITVTIDNNTVLDYTTEMIPATPQPSFTIPKEIATGSIITLSGNLTDPDSTASLWSWTINNSNNTGQNVFYQFNKAGNYTITLTVTDHLGATGSVTHTMQVVTPETTTTIVLTATIGSTTGSVTPLNITAISPNKITSVEVLVNDVPQNTTMTTEKNETYLFTANLNQKGLQAGTYEIQIIAFNNLSQSNSIEKSWTITGAYSGTNIFTEIVNSVGGPTGLIVLASALATITGLFVTLRDDHEETIDLNGAILKGKKNGALRVIKMAKNKMTAKKWKKGGGI